MRNLLYIVLAALLLGCNPKNIDDCLKTEGDTIRQEFDVAFFDRIIPRSRVKLFVQSGPTQQVIVETGDNLIDDVEVSVSDNTLQIFNNNGCNIFRDFELVRVFVTVPNLTTIRNGSGYAIESIGTLDFPELTLISEDAGEEDEFNTDGDFILSLNSNNLNIVNNNISNYFLSGTVNNFSVQLFNGDGRVDTPDLIAQNITILHRGSNKMILNPQQSLEGIIRGTGDVISINRPPVVDVEELNIGRLIFQ